MFLCFFFLFFLLSLVVRVVSCVWCRGTVVYPLSSSSSSSPRPCITATSCQILSDSRSNTPPIPLAVEPLAWVSSFFLLPPSSFLSLLTPSCFLPPVQVLGVDPPRPLPPAAYDLQTALESVQHFATQTLAGVVQAEATRGSSDFSDPNPNPNPSSSSGGGGAHHHHGGRAAKAKAAAKESREAAAAAGLGEGWEAAWPPRELTKELGLVTARQMAHAMRCDVEPLIQVR